MSCLTILGVVVKVDAQRHQHRQANLDGHYRWFEAYCDYCCQLPLYDIEKEVQHCTRAVFWVASSLNSAHWTLTLGVDEICVAYTGQQCSASSKGWCAEGACVGSPCVPASFAIRLFLLFSFTAHVTSVPCMKGSDIKWHQYTLGSCFRHWPFMRTVSSLHDLFYASRKHLSLVTVLDVLDFRCHSWQYLATLAVRVHSISEKVSAWRAQQMSLA